MLISKNYSQIIEKDGVAYLFDSRAFGMLCGRVDEIKPTYDEIKTALREHDYPDTEDFVRAVANGGADGLAEILTRDNDREAKRLKIPAYIAQQWRKSIVDDIPNELNARADALRAKLVRLMGDDFSISDKDIKFQDGEIVVDADAIKERVRPLTMAPISDQMRKEAEELRKIVPALRTLQENGLNIPEVAKQLMGNWLAPSHYPDLSDDVAVFSLLNVYRHASREKIKATSPEWYYLNGGER